jgi:hypothetical protein
MTVPTRSTVDTPPKRIWHSVRAILSAWRSGADRTPDFPDTRRQYGDIDGFSRAEREELGLTMTAWEILDRVERGRHDTGDRGPRRRNRNDSLPSTSDLTEERDDQREAVAAIDAQR